MFFSLLIVAFTLWGCKAQYAVTNVERSRILIDKRYDASHDAELQTARRQLDGSACGPCWLQHDCQPTRKSSV